MNAWETVVLYIVAPFSTLLIVTAIGWAAKCLFALTSAVSKLTEHVEDIPQIQSDVRVISKQIEDVRVEQAKVAGRLEAHDRWERSIGHSPAAPSLHKP